MSGLSVSFAGQRGRFSLDAKFEAAAGGVTALFGPSGAGKTSVLRAIAGLERYSGHCALGGEIWQDETRFVPAHRRPVGYVFQEASLFPHLSVRQNLEFGLRRMPNAPLLGFDDAVDLLGIGPLLSRAPDMLSGGERQRVALGRALLSQPEVLLLDEPMSALDRQAKDEIFPYFAELRRALTLPVLLVTHDIAEVERLADHLILMRDGLVVGAGPLNELLVGDALGLKTARDAASVLRGRIAGYDAADGLSEIDIGGQLLLIAGRAGETGAAVGVRIGARDVSLAIERPSATTILNVLAVVIGGLEPVSDAEVVVSLKLGSETMLARVTRRSLRELNLKVGQAVFAQIKGVSLVASPSHVPSPLAGEGGALAPDER